MLSIRHTVRRRKITRNGRAPARRAAALRPDRGAGRLTPRPGLAACRFPAEHVVRSVRPLTRHLLLMKVARTVGEVRQPGRQVVKTADDDVDHLALAFDVALGN